MLEALIPYVRPPEKTLIEHIPLIGPLKLQVFGPLVALGVVLGWKQCLRFAKAKDMDELLVRDLMFWILVWGFACAHWVSVIFYFPEQIRENPLVLVAFTNGLSSVGGFFGASASMVVLLRKRKQPVIAFADLLIFGLLLGWCFGRLGCALVHDHPGQVVEADFPLAVGPWPDGTWRHDLGLYEFLFTIALTAIVYFGIDWQNRKPGFIVGLVTTAYAPFRFALDFLRATDSARGVTSSPDLRYVGLTAAQWFTIAFFAVGVWLLVRRPRPEDLAWTKDSERLAREAAAAGPSTPTTANLPT